MTRDGYSLGWVMTTFKWVLDDVPPAKREYSPAESVVGMQIRGMFGAFLSPWSRSLLFGPASSRGLFSVRVSRSESVWTLFARA
jgi:hypothetical protein